MHQPSRARELVVLGTASQVPTRERNHNGYLLRWDGLGVLFDPGEGTQRQMTLAGVSASQVDAICITHAHGDHCLGLPGVLQRLSLDGVTGPLPLVHPAGADEYVDRLRSASVYDDRLSVDLRPVAAPGPVLELPGLTVHALPLQHSVPTYGYRLVEPDGRRMLRNLLQDKGIGGADVGRLQREGMLRTPGGVVELADVSEPRPGQRFAFVMDTAPCAEAVALARDADLLVCEATFGDAEADVAAAYGHLTARDAATIAREAGARRLVLTHFSQRYRDTAPLLAQARGVFPDTVVAHDLDRIPVPHRVR
ncbi:ribonuclease Z [Pedococcus cremeus]|uniref:Ribonuclease Z n=1 Tax=Pedococcus cremeus TaxID=587636 RepID=A0A1H9TMX9_9MICO|nr:ribonuclease Z [Pedococcus cremeus]SER98670.1 ribonuclease Z [Pedococcus cremeus]